MKFLHVNIMPPPPPTQHPHPPLLVYIGEVLRTKSEVQPLPKLGGGGGGGLANPNSLFDFCLNINFKI